MLLGYAWALFLVVIVMNTLQITVQVMTCIDLSISE